MKLFFLTLALVLSIIGPVLAADTFHYRMYETATNKTLETSVVHFDFSNSQVIKLTFEKGVTAPEQKEEFLFDNNYETLSWHVKNAATGTDYTGKRLANVIRIEGHFNGKAVTKDIKVDQNPFFAFPKFELRPLFLSQRKETSYEFWAMRQDTLEVYKMIASYRGEDTIKVGGKDMKVWKIYWSPANPLFRIFKRTYYYRQSDGMFVKQEYPDGVIREMIKEE